MKFIIICLNLVTGTMAMVLCMPLVTRTGFDLGRLATTAEVVVTGVVLFLKPHEMTPLLVITSVEVDCVYKNQGGVVKPPVTILIHGLSTHPETCLSVVKIGTRYIFFLTRTSKRNSFNVHHAQLQSGAIQIRRRMDLSAVLEAAYEGSFQPLGEMCHKNCFEGSEWSEWGECGASCGKGVMRRNLQPPHTMHRVRMRTRNFDCYGVEEIALCEVCPCAKDMPVVDDYYDLERDINTYFVHNGCQSTTIVKNKWCIGYCKDGYSMNVPMKWRVKTIRMICANGSVEFYNVAIIEECGCQKHTEDYFMQELLSGG